MGGVCSQGSVGAQRGAAQCLGERQTPSKDGVKSALLSSRVGALRKLSPVLQTQSSIAPGAGS